MSDKSFHRDDLPHLALVRRRKPVVTIREWEFQLDAPLAYDTGHKTIRLKGRVEGHPTVIDGHLAITSPIVRLDMAEHIVETENTIYRLED